LSDNINYWVRDFPMFAEVIRRSLLKNDVYFEPGTFNVFGFIDNTVYETARPGGGPTHEGRGSPRNHPYLQQAFYNGWKSVHGVKCQTVSLPNGMMCNIWGPVSVRHNDNYCLLHSNIQNRLLSAMSETLPVTYNMFGDSAYWADDCLRTYHRGDDAALTDRQKLENRGMKVERESIEWDYGEVGNLWRAVDFKYGLKLREQPVTEIVVVAMLLTNFWVTMNGGNTVEHFECMPPTIEDYTGNGPRVANVQFFDHWDEVVGQTFFDYMNEV